MNSLAVIVGRFQIPFFDHDQLIQLEKIITGSHKTLIVIGLAYAPASKDDPLSFYTRKEMIKSVFPKVDIMYIKDEYKDVDWSSNLDKMIRDNVKKTLGTDPNDGIKIYGSGKNFVSRYNGDFEVEVMEPISVKSEKVLLDFIKFYPNQGLDYRVGAFHVAANMWDNPMPCVDVVVIDWEKKQILLGRKPNQKEWRFFGGFAENELGSKYEDHALRELEEEASLSGGNIGPPVYITSATVNDWRYKHCDRKIMTVLFAVEYKNGTPKANDDIESCRWFSFEDLRKNYKTLMIGGHSEMFEYLKF